MIKKLNQSKVQDFSPFWEMKNNSNNEMEVNNNDIDSEQCLINNTNCDRP
jgi:hypothetical protein